MPRWRAAPPDALIIVPLDALWAAYHRPAGATHLLAEPAPQIIAALQSEPVGEAGLLARLAEQFDFDDAAAGAVRARLDELVAAGLVEEVTEAA